MDATVEVFLRAEEPDLTTMPGWVVTLDPPATAPDRTVLDLNAAGGAIQVGTTDGSAPIDWGQATITAYETQQGQFGNSVADFIYPNRTVTIELILGGTGAEDDQETARSQLQQKVALLQREGGQLLRQRAGGPAMHADVVNASLTLPDQWGETGDVEPGVVLTLECLPDWYGDEITLDAIPCTGICDEVLKLDGETAIIEGDYPARCRIIVTNLSDGEPQQEVRWGLRSRYYDPAETADLIIPASALLLAGGTTLASKSGSQFPEVATASVASGDRLILLMYTATGDFLTHLGSYRVLARVSCTVANASVSLHWTPSANEDDLNALHNDPAVIPEADEFYLVDLGAITVATPPVGSHVWYGGLWVNAAGTPSLSVDYLMFVPIDESSGHASSVPPAALIDVLVSLEARSDGYWQEFGSGAPAGLYGAVGMATGDLPRLPPSGLEQRPVELLAKQIRSDSNLNGQDSGIDPFAVQVIYQPCWLSRP